MNIAKKEGREGLALLDFPVEAQPVFNKEGKELGGYQVVVRPDTEDILGMVRSRYELVSHRQALDPFVEKLTGEGWQVKSVQVERHGSKAYVELINKELMKPVKVNDMVGRRLTIRNSYDGTSSVSAELGAFRLVCSNGLVAPSKTITRVSFAHVSNVFERLDDAGREYAETFDSMLSVYRGLSDKIVSPEIAQAILKEIVGRRKLDLVNGYWLASKGADGLPTAWNLYNAVTQYLTHSFEGAVETRDFKSHRALDLILKMN